MIWAASELEPDGEDEGAGLTVKYLGRAAYAQKRQ